MDASAPIPRKAFPDVERQWGVDLPWIIDSWQLVIFCAKLALEPQKATQQLGCWDSSPCTWHGSPLNPASCCLQGPHPLKQDALLWEGKGACNYCLVDGRKHLDSLSWTTIG